MKKLLDIFDRITGKQPFSTATYDEAHFVNDNGLDVEQAETITKKRGSTVVTFTLSAHPGRAEQQRLDQWLAIAGHRDKSTENNQAMHTLQTACRAGAIYEMLNPEFIFSTGTIISEEDVKQILETPLSPYEMIIFQRYKDFEESKKAETSAKREAQEADYIAYTRAIHRMPQAA